MGYQTGWTAGRNRISFNSTSSGWGITKATMLAMVLAGTPILPTTLLMSSASPGSVADPQAFQRRERHNKEAGYSDWE